MATRGLTLQPSSSLTRRVSSQPAAIDPAIGHGERHTAPGGLPRIGHRLPVRREERLHLGGRRRGGGSPPAATEREPEREAAGEASGAAHRPQRGGWGDGWRGPGTGTMRRGTRGAAW